MTDYTKIPDIPGDFFMTRGGDFKNSNDKSLKVSVKLTGCRVRLGKKTYKVSDMWGKTFGSSENEIREITDFLEGVEGIRTQRLMWKVFDDHVKVKVLYQGGGVMGTEIFEILHIVDALLIFKQGGIFRNKWSPYWSPQKKRF